MKYIPYLIKSAQKNTFLNIVRKQISVFIEKLHNLKYVTSAQLRKC